MKNGCYLNSQFGQNLAWLQSEVCYFINWLTKDLIVRPCKVGASRHNLVMSWKSSTPDRASVFYSTWFPINSWLQSCNYTYSWITRSFSNIKEQLFPMCTEYARSNILTWWSIMCYVPWYKVLAGTKTLGRDVGLFWFLLLRQLGKVITAFMNDLPQFIWH